MSCSGTEEGTTVFSQDLPALDCGLGAEGVAFLPLAGGTGMADAAYQCHCKRKPVTIMKGTNPGGCFIGRWDIDGLSVSLVLWRFSSQCSQWYLFFFFFFLFLLLPSLSGGIP